MATPFDPTNATVRSPTRCDRTRIQKGRPAAVPSAIVPLVSTSARNSRASHRPRPASRAHSIASTSLTEANHYFAASTDWAEAQPIRLLVAGFFFLFVRMLLRLGCCLNREVQLCYQLVIHVNFYPIFADRPAVGWFTKIKIAIVGISLHAYRLLKNFGVSRSDVANIFGDQNAANFVARCYAFRFEYGDRKSVV